LFHYLFIPIGLFIYSVPSSSIAVGLLLCLFPSFLCIVSGKLFVLSVQAIRPVSIVDDGLFAAIWSIGAKMEIDKEEDLQQ
jgi:hypothetical protein